MGFPNSYSPTPFDAIIFDCDGTLTAIEGIDELAKLVDTPTSNTPASTISHQVQLLTATAMSRTGLNEELYQRRLDLIRPNYSQIEILGEQYYSNRIPCVEQVISILQRLNKKIYIISAGLLPAVVDFASRILISQKNIYAVDIYFDSNGEYRDFDHASPLITNQGKKIIVEQIKQQHHLQTIMYVGDGVNDLSVIPFVNKFVGFGGAFFRQNIADKSDFYIDVLSLAPLLSQVLTEDEVKQLSVDELSIYKNPR